MLVLTRKRSEVIQIGNDIIVKVIRTGRSTVKIGIEAPAHVRVLRGELCDGTHHPVPDNSGSRREENREEMVANCSDQFPHPYLV